MLPTSSGDPLSVRSRVVTFGADPPATDRGSYTHRMVHFDLTLTTGGSLHPDGDPSEFISVHTGTIRCLGEDDRLRRVGRMRAYRIHADLAREAGASIFDVCDCDSQEMHELYAAIFDVDDDDLRQDLRDEFDGFDGDVLVLDYVLLSPKWRGLRIGLLAARKVIDLLGGGCGLVVCDISPLNPHSALFATIPSGWIPRQTNPDERRTANRKLRRYYRQMGFRRIVGTRYYGLSTAQPTPSLAELLKRPE